MNTPYYLGIDCGSVSLNLVLIGQSPQPVSSLYLRTGGRPLKCLLNGLEQLIDQVDRTVNIRGALVTGSGRKLLSKQLSIPSVNEIAAHAAGSYSVDPRIRTIIEIGGQDSKFIRIEPSETDPLPSIGSFRMNEICAAGTGAFLDEQAARLGIQVEEIESIASSTNNPAPIAGRCAVFAKTDMIHRAQEGTPLPEILLGVAFALARNYLANLVRGDSLVPLVSLQGGVMANGAVVRAFQEILGLADHELVIPPHFKVLGALGSAVIAQRKPFSTDLSLLTLLERAGTQSIVDGQISRTAPLAKFQRAGLASDTAGSSRGDHAPPYVMGLDVGSVSVKGVIIDSKGTILAQDYRLSQGRPLESLEKVTKKLIDAGFPVHACSVTGSGRSLIGRLMDADLIVNEISAQARAAIEHDPEVDTIIEIGGQDSKWIALENRGLKDFEMNRVCAAGTGSFLMEQAERLDLPMGVEFSDCAFASQGPADLGTRCTVFMESDLVHHQNNGATREDLAAGVCLSIVRNYLERVANHKPLGDRIMFLGGVAANEAVRASFESTTGRRFDSPRFFKVSGAYGAALKLLDAIGANEVEIGERLVMSPEFESLEKEQFTCHGCSNECTIDKYLLEDRVAFLGGLCDRWESERRSLPHERPDDLFTVRSNLLNGWIEEASPSLGAAIPQTRDGTSTPSHGTVWGMVRSPQFYEWFPFWKAFCAELGIGLVVSPESSRGQFERGLRLLRVETCLPVKAMAGHVADLVDQGVETIFHPAILAEPSAGMTGKAVDHCPYIQVSSQFFRGSVDVEWQEPIVDSRQDPDAIRNEHVRFAQSLGFSHARAIAAFERGRAAHEHFQESLAKAGRDFMESLGDSERAVVVLGKPYHTADPFLNMQFGSLCARLGVKAIPGDLLPTGDLPTRSPLTWKHQLQMLAAARSVAADPRLYPVMITSFGCGPDPFTMRHLKASLGEKPLLVVEMDEHTSRAGVITRLEAFLDHIAWFEQRTKSEATVQPPGPVQKRGEVVHENRRAENPVGAGRNDSRAGERTDRPKRSAIRTKRRIDSVFMPHFGDHSYAFTAAIRSFDIDAQVLPPADEDSHRLGRPHLMGGECHPYALMLGDYLKHARGLPEETARRSLYCIPGYSACRLGQYPVYVDKVRKECGYAMRTIADLSQALTAFGLSKKHRQEVLLRTWEGLNAYDVLLSASMQIRANTEDPDEFAKVYEKARQALFSALSKGRGRAGLEESLGLFEGVRVSDRIDRPTVAVTGDYYTRVVDFANNDVYSEIERLGGIVLTPPTFSDGLKLYYFQEAMDASGTPENSILGDAGAFYAKVILSELDIKGAARARRYSGSPLDPIGIRTRRTAAAYMNHRYPPGVLGPFATAMHAVEQGADGILNLITLNCSYGTVVTAALNNALKRTRDVPMLTLIYDGLKKTNEATRLEAFMEQVWDGFRRRRRTQ